jgi:hypothetical protein
MANQRVFITFARPFYFWRQKMDDILKIHEEVLQFLLDWRVRRDPDLLFTLRRRPVERLQVGQWFLGNQYYLAFSFWTGKDWVNKTQNIYIEIDSTGGFRVRFSAKDDPDKAEVLGAAAEVLGLVKAKHPGYTGNVWTKEYEGTDYLSNLERFLSEDKKRIDALLEIQKKQGYNAAFQHAFNRLDPETFRESLEVVQRYRSAKETSTSPNPAEKAKTSRDLELIGLEINNTGLFEKCEIRFGSRATCLIGENGGGKTTLLRAAALGLVGTGSPLLDTRASFELQTLLRIAGADEDLRLRYAGKGSIGVSYRFNGKVFQNGKANLIPMNPQPDTGIVEFNEDRIEDDGFGLPVGDSGMDGDGELPILVVGYPQRYGKKPDGTDIKRRSPKPNAFDILPLILNTEDNRIEGFKIWVSETWNQGENQRKKIFALFDIISAVLSRDGEEPFTIRIKSAVSYRKIVVTTPFNPDGIPFDLLSTGLSNLFGWVGHLVSRMHEAYPDADEPMHEPAIVFVDEIDNYLHPLVQARAIPVLLEAFPKVQFIFTSHSPVVLAASPNEGVKAYRVEDGGAFEIPYFYGRTVEDILEEYYGIKKRPAQKIQEQIDRMMRALALGRKEEGKQLYHNLLPALGKDEPVMQDAQNDLL